MLLPLYCCTCRFSFVIVVPSPAHAGTAAAFIVDVTVVGGDATAAAIFCYYNKVSV